MSALDEATTSVEGHWRLTKSGKRVWVTTHDRTIEDSPVEPSTIEPSTVEPPVLDVPWWEMTYEQVSAKYPHIFTKGLMKRRLRQFHDALQGALRRSEPITDYLTVEVPDGLKDVRVAFYNADDPADFIEASMNLGHPRDAAASANPVPTEPVGTTPLPIPPLIIAWTLAKKEDLNFVLTHELGHVADARSRPQGAFTSGVTEAQVQHDEVTASVFAERLIGRLSKHQMKNVGGNVTNYRNKGTTRFTVYGGNLFEVRPEHHRVADLWLPGKRDPLVPVTQMAGFVQYMGIQEADTPVIEPERGVHHVCLMGTLIMSEDEVPPSALRESAVERAHVLAERLHTTTILERIESRLTDELEEAFRAQAKAFVAMYAHDHEMVHPLLEAQATSQSWVNSFEYASERTRSKFRRSLGAAVWAALRAGGDFALATLQMDPVLSFELPNPRAERYMDEHGATLIRRIEETTRDRIRDTVAQGVQEGASPDDIARRIKRMYAGFSTPQPQQHIKDRAHLIAVTEMGNAYTFGNLEVARNLQEAGLKLEKRWLHVKDPRVDPDCLRNEAAGWLPLEAQYPTGHIAPLAHPACRCDQLYRLAESEFTEHLATGTRAQGYHDEKSHGVQDTPWWEMTDEQAKKFHQFFANDPKAVVWLRALRLAFKRSVPITSALSGVDPRLADTRITWLDPAYDNAFAWALGLPGPDEASAFANPTFGRGDRFPLESPPLIVAWKGAMDGDEEFILAHELGHVATRRMPPLYLGSEKMGLVYRRDPEEVAVTLFAERMLGRLMRSHTETYGGNVIVASEELRGQEVGKWGRKENLRPAAYYEGKQFSHYGGTAWEVRPEWLQVADYWMPDKPQPRIPTKPLGREVLERIHVAPLRESLPEVAGEQVWVCDFGAVIMAEAALTEHLVTGLHAQGEHDERSHGRSRIGIAPGSALQSVVKRGMGVEEFAKYDAEALRILAEHKVELSHFSVGRGYWGQANTNEQEFDIGMVLNGPSNRVEAAAEALRKHWKQTEVIVWHRHKGGTVPTASFSLRGSTAVSEPFLVSLAAKYVGKKGGWHVGFEFDPEVVLPDVRSMRKELAKVGIVWNIAERQLFIARPNGQTSRDFTSKMRRLGEVLMAHGIADSVSFEPVEAVHLRDEGPLRVVESQPGRGAGLGAERDALRAGVDGSRRAPGGDGRDGEGEQAGLGREPSDVEDALAEATTNVAAHYRRTKNGMTLVRSHDREVGDKMVMAMDPTTGATVLRPAADPNDTRHWWEMPVREVAARWPEVVHNKDGQRQARIALLANYQEAFKRAVPVTDTFKNTPAGLRDVRVAWYDPFNLQERLFARDSLGLMYPGSFAASNVGLLAPVGVVPMETPPLILAWSKHEGTMDKEFTIAHELGHIADARSLPERALPNMATYANPAEARRTREISANLYAERVLGRVRASQRSQWGGNMTALDYQGKGQRQFTMYGGDVHAVTAEHLALVDKWLPGTVHPRILSTWAAENIPIREALVVPWEEAAANDGAMVTTYGCMEGAVLFPNAKAEPLVEHGGADDPRGPRPDHDEMSHGRGGARQTAGVGVDFGDPIPGDEFKPRRATPLRPRLKPSPQSHTNTGLWFADNAEMDDVLVHGTITRNGKEIPHAWIERGHTVIDASRDYKEPYKVGKEAFYRLAGVNKDSIQRFSAQAALENIMERGTHGPWKPLKTHVEPTRAPIKQEHIETALQYAAANNQGRKNPDGTRSAPWTLEQIRAEMKVADAALSGTNTHTLYSKEKWRQKLQQQWLDEMYGKGSKPEAGAKPQAYVYIGPPGAGKSFLSKIDATTLGSKPVEIDADLFKMKMPEYEGGLGADRTHDESSFLKGELLNKAIERRDNISMPIVGKTYASLKQQIMELHFKGYDVHLRLTNVTPQMSTNRVLTRFVHDGRYIKADYAYTAVDSLPEHNYVRLLDDPEISFASNVAYMTMGKTPVPYKPEQKRKQN